VRSGASPADQSVTFVFDGVTYLLDLSNGNAGKIRGLMQPWLDAETEAELAADTGI
jgi:hypothetical protein